MRLPSGSGGLTRYFDEYKSKVQIAPGHLIILAALIVIIVVILHYFGSVLFGV